MIVPENPSFPFMLGADGRVLQFMWRAFDWKPMVGTPDVAGYRIASWMIRDERGKAMKRAFCRVHRIVWELHNGPVPEGLEIDHIDGNKQNNDISNLRAVSHSENLRFARALRGDWSKRILTGEQIQTVLALPSDSPWAALARELGVTKQHLLNLRSLSKRAYLAKTS